MLPRISTSVAAFLAFSCPISVVVPVASADPVLQGYDVVEFFSLSQGDSGVMGLKQYSAELLSQDLMNVTDSDEEKMPDQNYTFYFKDKANLNTFNNDPWKYAPQYGGFWAIGMAIEAGWNRDAMGPMADAETSWVVYDGRLFVNYSPAVLDTFLEDPASYAALADEVWTELWGGLQAGPFNDHCFPNGPNSCQPDPNAVGNGDDPEVAPPGGFNSPVDGPVGDDGAPPIPIPDEGANVIENPEGSFNPGDEVLGDDDPQ